MTVQNPWAKHYQSVWEERAADRLLPLWARISFIAFEGHKANGHAVFQRGQLAMLMGKPGVNGFEPEDKRNIQRTIHAAIANRWLDPQSCSECLVVPSHAVEGGLGSAIKSASVRWLANPSQLANTVAMGGFTVAHQGGFDGFTIGERIVLDRFRVRAK